MLSEELRHGVEGRAIRLLLVTANASEALSIQQLVNAQRLRAYEIWTAPTGQLGLDLCARSDPDCILLNDALPDMGSSTFLDRLTQLDGTLPTAVVLLVAQADTERAAQAMRRGSLDYVVKEQLSTEALHRSVSNAVEKAALRRELHQKDEALKTFIESALEESRRPFQRIIRNVRALERILQRVNKPEAVQSAHTHLQELYAAFEQSDDLLAAIETYAHFLRRPANSEPVNLHPLAEQVVAQLYAEFPALQGAVTVTLKPLPTVLGDSEALRHLFYNLLHNAFVHGGRTHLKVVVEASSHSHHWQLRVSDNGMGISTQLLPRVLQPFQRRRTAIPTKGCGMGLAVSARVVEHHGGIIWVESEWQRGTTVYFTLPQIGYRPAVDLAALPLGAPWVAALPTSKRLPGTMPDEHSDM